MRRAEAEERLIYTMKKKQKAIEKNI